MNKRYRLLLFILSLLISIVLIYGMYLFQIHYIRSEQMVSIYVANKWMPAGHIVAITDLKQKLFPISAIADDIVHEPNTLIGKELIIPIGMDEPIASWKLNSFHLLPLNGQATFQIPAEYVKSMANDIRAGDYVYLFLSHSDGASEQLFTQPIKVASVKTSNNVEVESLGHDELNALILSNEVAFYQHRRKATGVVEYINLNLHSEEWLLIDERCKNGQSKLIIAYTPFYVEEVIN